MLTRNVEENEILHEIFRASRLPRYILGNRLPLGQCMLLHKHSLATISRHSNWNLRGTKGGTKGRRD